MSQETKTPKWLTIAQGAELYNIHRNTIRNAIRSGRLPAQRLGRNIIRINQADLESLFSPYRGGEFGIWSR